MRLTPVFKIDQLITVFVKFQTDEREFLVSFVYASNAETERGALWSDRQSHYNSAIYKHMRWEITGDFNEILPYEESLNDTKVCQTFMNSAVIVILLI